MLEIEGVLAHVPHVALLVLRVPIERSLHRLPMLGDRVPDHRAPDAENGLGLMSYDLIVGLRGLSADAHVVQGGARLEGQVAVVDRGDEVRPVDRRRVAPMDGRQPGR